MFWSTVTRLQRGDSVKLAKERDKAKKKLQEQLAAAAKENLVQCIRHIAAGQLLAKTDPAYHGKHKKAEQCCLKALKDQPENSKVREQPSARPWSVVILWWVGQAHALLGLCKYFLSFYRTGEQLEDDAKTKAPLREIKASPHRNCFHHCRSSLEKPWAISRPPSGSTPPAPLPQIAMSSTGISSSQWAGLMRLPFPPITDPSRGVVRAALASMPSVGSWCDSAGHGGLRSIHRDLTPRGRTVPTQGANDREDRTRGTPKRANPPHLPGAAGDDSL